MCKLNRFVRELMNIGGAPSIKKNDTWHYVVSIDLTSL